MNESMDGKCLGGGIQAAAEQHRDAQSFLTEGNKHFIRKEFVAAISAYSRGLEEVGHCAEQQENKSDKSRVALELLSNRAAAYISLQNYSSALVDTEQALVEWPWHFKAIVRKCKALAGLGEFDKGIDYVSSAISSKKGKSNNKLSQEEKKELGILLEKLKRMKEQSETGDFYDVPLIMDKPQERAPPDWVDYHGPVKVEKFLGKGRGLVAAEDLPAGKLIFACRAFEILFVEEGANLEEGLSEESKEKLESGAFHVENDYTLNLLARKIYDKLKRSPEKRSELYSLHAGNELRYLEPPSDPSKVVAPPDLDMARIYGICKCNTFANAGDSYPEVEKSVAIWIFPSFVNHYCIGGNCTWKIFGDYIFVRTFKPVKKGDELIHSYISPAFPLQVRTETLTRRLGFICNCVLCELDRALPKSVHEEKLKLKQLVANQEIKFAQLDSIQDSAEFAKQFQASASILEQIIAKLEKLQPKHGNYNASLLDPLQKLGLKYFGVGDFERAAKIMERACTMMTACMLPHGVADCAMWVVASHLQTGKVKQAQKWGKVLRENLILAYGDVHVLKVVGPWLIEPLSQWGLMD